MLRVILLAIFVLGLTPPAAFAATCSGADPAVVSATYRLAGSDGGANRYRLTIRVVNVGSTGQASNVLQFVDIYEHGTKLDAKGIPPLGAGQSYSVTYMYKRATDAGNGTARFAFQLDMRQPAGVSGQNCGAANDRFRLVL
jgi:hypothetical protein